MTEHSKESLLAVSNAVRDAVTPLSMQHDGRLLFACLVAEAAHLGAQLCCAGVYSPSTVAGMMAEGLVTAVTLKAKAKVMYHADGVDVGSKQ